MELVRFAYENLRRKPKNAYFFAFSIAAAAAIITLFFSILGNPYYGTESMSNMVEAVTFADFDGGIGNGIFTMMLSLLMIFICIMTVFFSNKFYLMSKLDDIAIMMISGCNITRLAKFLIVQNFIVVLIATPIGALIGFALHPVANNLIYQEMGIHAPVFLFSMTSLSYCMVTLCLVAIWLIIADAGFVYRMDSLKTLLHAKKSMNPLGKPQNIFFKSIYVVLFFLLLYYLTTLDTTYINAIFMIYIGIFIVLAPARVFRYVFPDIIHYLQNNFFYSDKCRVISSGNLCYSIINGNLLVTITLLTTSILFFYLCKFREDAATFMIVFLTYIVSMLLICICMCYKLSSDALNKKRIFANMMAIGYLKQDIKRIIHQEVCGFFFLLILISLPLLTTILSMYLQAGVITMTFLISMLLIFVVMILLAGFFMYHIYCRLIFKEAWKKPIVNE